MHFVTRATLIDDINGKSHKMELKNSTNYSNNHTKSLNRSTSFYGLGGVHTHTYPHESDFKKLAKRLERVNPQYHKKQQQTQHTILLWL